MEETERRGEEEEEKQQKGHNGVRGMLQRRNILMPSFLFHRYSIFTRIQHGL